MTGHFPSCCSSVLFDSYFELLLQLLFFPWLTLLVGLVVICYFLNLLETFTFWAFLCDVFLHYMNYHITIIPVSRMKEMLLNMILNDKNYVSLIVFHCSLECVTLNAVLQSECQMCCINNIQFISWYFCCDTHAQKCI